MAYHIKKVQSSLSLVIFGGHFGCVRADQFQKRTIQFGLMSYRQHFCINLFRGNENIASYRLSAHGSQRKAQWQHFQGNNNIVYMKNGLLLDLLLDFFL